MSVPFPSADMEAFRRLVKEARHVVILTGAGVSAESGVPTFRGAGGFWRTYRATDLATPRAFRANPSLVWEFYHHRREGMAAVEPNPAHRTVADFQRRLRDEGRRAVVVTQNIDELHQRAGTEDVVELHGSLFKTRCTRCRRVESNYDRPICEALRNKGQPDPHWKGERIPESDLPRCKESSCRGLLRPHVVWFHENLNPAILRRTDEELDSCDLCLVVGTSSVVYPAAMFAPRVAERGVPVAEFNMEVTPVTHNFGFHFQGPAGELLPVALAP